jgi:predicted Zn-dependent protease
MKDRIYLLEDIYVDISSTASKSNVKALLSIAKQYIFNTKQEFVFGTATN